MSNLIKSIEFIPLNTPVANWSLSTCIVKVTDENGVYGIGETDGNPDAMHVFANCTTQHKWWTNLTEVLIGRDPIEFDANWDLMYEKTRWIAQRGFGLFAISGIDMALYDLAGKQHNLPAYKLMGGAYHEKVTPYFTLYPHDLADDCTPDEAVEAYRPLLEKAKALKVKAVKVVIKQESTMTKYQVVDYLKKCRAILGYDIDMMMDGLYHWTDWEEVRWILDNAQEVDLYFAEALLPHDDLAGHKKLTDRVKTRVCGAEMSTTRFEILQWLKETGVSVLQPDYNRCGGLTELRRIRDMAEQYSVQVIPHNWRTGISNAAAHHFAVSSKYTQYVEYPHPEFFKDDVLQNLTTNVLPIIDGYLMRPELPGLGIDINREFFKKVTGRDF